MIRIFKQRSFNLYKNSNNSFVIYNTNKPFKNGHTHIDNYHTARYMIKLACQCSVPKKLSIYLIDSLIRISTDDGYIRQLNILKQQEFGTYNNDKKT